MENSMVNLMENSTITLTFGDVGENHKGMQKIGNMVEKGDGFNLTDLKEIKKKFKKLNCECELYYLNKELIEDEEADDAHVLVIRNAIQNILKDTKYTYDELLTEQLNLEYDKKAFMYGRVVNKNARYNLLKI